MEDKRDANGEELIWLSGIVEGIRHKVEEERGDERGIGFPMDIYFVSFYVVDDGYL